MKTEFGATLFWKFSLQSLSQSEDSSVKSKTSEPPELAKSFGVRASIEHGLRARV